MAASELPAGCTGTPLAIFQVTVPHNPNFGQVVAVLYGFVPFISGSIAIVYLIVISVLQYLENKKSLPKDEQSFQKLFKGFDQYPLFVAAYVFCVFAAVPIVCDIVKSAVDEPRPYGSCINSKGMPSGHTGNVVANLIYLSIILLFGYFKRRFSMLKKVLLCLLVFAVFAPVPWSRTFTKDHAWNQILVGSLIAVSIVCVWFVLIPFAWRGPAEVDDQETEKYLQKQGYVVAQNNNSEERGGQGNPKRLKNQHSGKKFRMPSNSDSDHEEQQRDAISEPEEQNNPNDATEQGPLLGSSDGNNNINASTNNIRNTSSSNSIVTGFVEKKSNRKNWYFGLSIRRAVIVHMCLLTFTLVGQVTRLILSNSAEKSVRHSWPIAIVMFLTIVSCVVGLVRKSPAFMLIAAIFSGTLFISATILYSWQLFGINDSSFSHTNAEGEANVANVGFWLTVVLNLIIVYISMLSMFNCVSYRGQLIADRLEEKERRKNVAMGQNV